MIEEGRWRRKQVKDSELRVAESNLKRVLTHQKREVVLYILDYMFVGIEFLRIGRY